MNTDKRWGIWKLRDWNTRHLKPWQWAHLPFSRKVRYRVLVLGVGLLLVGITVALLLAPVSPWWAAPSGYLAFGLWRALIEGWVSLWFARSGDGYRHRPGDPDL